MQKSRLGNRNDQVAMGIHGNTTPCKARMLTSCSTILVCEEIATTFHSSSFYPLSFTLSFNETGGPILTKFSAQMRLQSSPPPQDKGNNNSYFKEVYEIVVPLQDAAHALTAWTFALECWIGLGPKFSYTGLLHSFWSPSLLKTILIKRHAKGDLSTNFQASTLAFLPVVKEGTTAATTSTVHSPLLKIWIRTHKKMAKIPFKQISISFAIWLQVDNNTKQKHWPMRTCNSCQDYHSCIFFSSGLTWAWQPQVYQ